MSEDANCLKQALIHMPNLENLDLSDNSVENGFRLVGLHLSDSMWDDWGLIFFWSFLYTLSKYNTIYHFKYNRYKMAPSATDFIRAHMIKKWFPGVWSPILLRSLAETYPLLIWSLRIVNWLATKWLSF